MNWYKTAIEAGDIEYLGNYDFDNAHFVEFRIGSDYWAYKLSFPDWVQKIKQMAKYSPARALNWAKKNKSEECKVRSDFPAFGSIIRCSGDKDED